MGEGEGKAKLQHFPDVSLSDVFEVRMRLEDIDLLEEDSCDSGNNDAQDLPNPFEVLGDEE